MLLTVAKTCGKLNVDSVHSHGEEIMLGGEVIYVTMDQSFAQYVADVMGNDSALEGSRKTGISSPYIGEMRKGMVPGEQILLKFAKGYGIPIDTLFRLAERARPSVDAEVLLVDTCEAAGLSTLARMRVVQAFRTERDRRARENENEDAA